MWAMRRESVGSSLWGQRECGEPGGQETEGEGRVQGPECVWGGGDRKYSLLLFFPSFTELFDDLAPYTEFAWKTREGAVQ